MGWLAWLVRLTAFAALCNLFADYLSYFLPVAAAGPGRAAVIVAVVALLAAVNIAGVRLASMFINIATVGKLVPLVLLVVAGSFFIDPQNYSLAVLPSYTGFSGSVLLLMFAFTGFEIAVIPAGEARDPRRHLPFALLTGTAIVGAALRGDSGRLHRHAARAGDLAAAAGRCRRSPVREARRRARVARRLDLGDGNDERHHAGRAQAAVCDGRAATAAAVVFSHTQRASARLTFRIGVSAAGMLVLTLSGSFASAATLSTIIRLDDLCRHVRRAPGVAAKERSRPRRVVRRSRGRDRVHCCVVADRVDVLQQFLDRRRTGTAGRRYRIAPARGLRLATPCAGRNA